ncbi:MAG: penicillin-binding transpeptidase domain-containing protein [Actinomycetes bacterium]
MSVASPPKGSSRRRGEGRPTSRSGDPEHYRQGWIGRLYESSRASFRLKDGSFRLRALLIGALIVFSIFAARLIDLQAVHAEEMASKARGGRTVTVKEPAIRGAIYDRNGVPLVETIPAKNVSVDPYVLQEVAQKQGIPLADVQADYARKLSPIIGLTEPKIMDLLTPRVNSTGTQIKFAYLVKKINLDQWDQVNALGLPGLYSEPTALRYYPSGALAANMLGFTTDPDDQGIKGVAGLEGLLNSELAGTDGSKTYERSGTGGQIPTGNEDETEAVPGSSYRLTIDRDLQYFAQQAITKRAKDVKAESAVCLVMDVKTGQILALGQSPTSDPNSTNRDQNFQFGLQNLAVTQTFEPGSTAKVMTMASVLEEGKADPTTVFRVPNELVRGGFPFKDDVKHPTYFMTMAGVLAQSSNIGTIQAAELIGPDKLYEYLQKFGVGTLSGLNDPTEQPGYLPVRSKWNPLTFPNLAYGQAMSVNAIQAAGVYAAMANGGVRVTPSLIESMTRNDGTTETPPEPTSTRVVSEATSRKFVKAVEHRTFSGREALRRGQRVLYVTERCVFQLVAHDEAGGALELIEIAPGIDLERDVLAHMDFMPSISAQLKLMDAALFADEPMGLRERMLTTPLAQRFELDREHRLLFINFEGLAIDTLADVAEVEHWVQALLTPLVTTPAQRVAVVVNYDSFTIVPALVDEYSAMVRRLTSRFYSRVTRYGTGGFVKARLDAAKLTPLG